MSIITKLGNRYYEFFSDSDFLKAKNLWPQANTQNDFETMMEHEGITYYYNMFETDEDFPS